MLGGCLVIVAQWQGTGSSGQVRLLVTTSFSLFSPHNKNVKDPNNMRLQNNLVDSAHFNYYYFLQDWTSLCDNVIGLLCVIGNCTSLQCMCVKWRVCDVK